MKNISLTLIDSTYSALDAKEVLNQLLSDKIKFIDRQLFRNQERGVPFDQSLDQRGIELRKARKEMMDFLNSLDKDVELDINCEVLCEAKQLT